MLPAEIDALLETLAVSTERVDPSTWRAVITGAYTRSYRIFVHLGSALARVELSPLMPLPGDPARAAAVMRELLRKNRTLVEARFALDDDGDIVIETLLDPAHGIPALHAAIDAVCTAAEAHFSRLQAL